MKFDDFVTGRGSEVDSYIGWLLVSLAYFKSAHLETKSYARHKAYDFYFTEIQGPLDQFSEQWLGYSGKQYKAALPSASDLPKDTILFLDEMIKSSERVYKVVPKAIQSTLDDIVGVFFQTKYLLTLE
ncbi:starvation-inducible transcriptional regulator [Escherichia phage vB_EcoM_RZ]|uniref:Uncharacterized protein n=6 Tax=Gaprivervirus TaxID=1913654 RepID=A0A0A7HCJ2_9CAUD|nr:starvation-inducible transcriptional regulator [Shigella phage SP18]YP_004063792.1 starvation-inducible transcriptional regulator [Escherichia phage vB_EcoM_VR7]YP_009207282.1 starvation-inducible transcriptional regulator [Escherichia phage vB_EcoM_VR20]YP_009209850.1 starvation-inducible transcriptional regulator [Escherichia phage vB_EcoM_VR25]YP_009213943.1 starvation-inducible transcriptional regulator [Escherichia phage vB_EcoM_VR26]YP_010650972.1 starvation-inducible transcriptional 